jgi:hypothetical protein
MDVDRWVLGVSRGIESPTQYCPAMGI